VIASTKTSPVNQSLGPVPVSRLFLVICMASLLVPSLADLS
jgi:hypothetical protein